MSPSKMASESLEAFTKIEESANNSLDEPPTKASEALANVNIANNPNPIENINRIIQANRDAYKQLSNEPAIARIIVEDENGNPETYYICRGTQMSVPGIKLASYRAPIGRLVAFDVGEVALDVGEDDDLSNGRIFIIQEKTEFKNVSKYNDVKHDNKWDSRPSYYDSESTGPLTIKSLRDFLDDVPIDEPDVTEQPDIAKEESEIVRKGRFREVIDRAGLRDQSLLDQHQDKIFRLPLDSRLLILGAPGTGKTTTLIRRLGLKLDTEYLEEDELRAIDRISRSSKYEHSRSWIMFTPTELLGLYVKEAFNREGIPAPEEYIRTWENFRRDIARNEFRILSSATNKRGYVMKQSPVSTLKAGTEADLGNLFTDFDEWQKEIFLDNIRTAAIKLSEHGDSEGSRIGNKILTNLNAAGSNMSANIFVSFVSETDQIRDLLKSLKSESDREINRSLNLHTNRDPEFLNELASIVSGLSDELQDDSEDQDSEQDSEDDEEESTQSQVQDPSILYMRAVRSHARARARKRYIKKSSRNRHIIEWLDDRIPPEDDLVKIGRSLILQSSLRWFLNSIRRYVNGVPGRYRRYRQIRQAEKKWYTDEEFKPTDIHPLEVDIMLLAMMRITDDFVRNASGLYESSFSVESIYDRLKNLYRTQVFVDEATDFSPIQLACMKTLAHPEIDSFFSCGDFNQRITSWGTRKQEQMEWAVPNIETQSISIGYRQSQKLISFARKLAGLTDGNVVDVDLPNRIADKNFPPVLKLNISEEEDIAKWLGDRIYEIEKSIKKSDDKLPSIAVLVNSEDEVSSMASALGDALTEYNISVTPCRDGQTIGRENEVRVFNVEHIKGLEFEAVFFVGIDRLAAKYPDLFDKYLYVGATRAATYLGITCDEELPARISELEEEFGEDWSQ